MGHKILAVIRLSRETEESTSPERQREQIARYAELYGHTVVGEAIDLDVSGAVSPWDRERLSPWLTEEPPTAWTALCCAKLDRLTRKITDFAELLEWCQTRDKTIMSVAEGLDFGTAAGRMYANVLVSFGQFERERMAERRREAAKTLREIGRFGGGQVPWGYEIAHTATGRILVPDPDTAAVIEEAARRMIGGDTLSGIARWLGANGVPTPRGSRKRDGKVYTWSAASVRDALRSRSLLGEMTHKGAVVRGADGTPIRREPILDDATWHSLQRALDRAARPTKGGHRHAAYLLQIAFCGHQTPDGGICGQPLYRTTAGNGSPYYRCKSRLLGRPCGERTFPMVQLDAMADDIVDTIYGDAPVRVTKTIHGDDHVRKELDEIGRMLRDLMDERVRGVGDPIEIDRSMTNLLVRRDELARMEPAPSETVVVETGETVRGRLAGKSREERRRFMLGTGLRVAFHHAVADELASEVVAHRADLPPDVQLSVALAVRQRPQSGEVRHAILADIGPLPD